MTNTAHVPQYGSSRLGACYATISAARALNAQKGERERGKWGNRRENQDPQDLGLEEGQNTTIPGGLLQRRGNLFNSWLCSFSLLCIFVIYDFIPLLYGFIHLLFCKHDCVNPIFWVFISFIWEWNELLVLQSPLFNLWDTFDLASLYFSSLQYY